MVFPDSSPRDLDNYKDINEFGVGYGAGFYCDATEEPWSLNFNMYSYITKELPLLVEKCFPVTSRKSIMGHSMGGHGALVIGLKNGQRFKAISAFSPILPVAASRFCSLNAF